MTEFLCVLLCVLRASTVEQYLSCLQDTDNVLLFVLAEASLLFAEPVLDVLNPFV